MTGSFYSYRALVVPKLLVKKVKDALARNRRLDRNVGIKPVTRDDKYEIVKGDTDVLGRTNFFVPVTHIFEDGEVGIESLPELISLLELQNDEEAISLALVNCGDAGRAKNPEPRTNLLARSILQWLHDFCQGPDHAGLECSSRKNVASHNWTYSIYPPLLLLPTDFLTNMTSILKTTVVPDDLSSLYVLICKNFKATHVALNAPIPMSVSDAESMSSMISTKAAIHPESKYSPLPNILRSPTGLLPLCGDFGPSLPRDRQVMAEDFAAAFWCTAQQNGIYQTWAPRYTMFSRGNISEKARLLSLESLTSQSFRLKPQEISVVDLYAGIGYFAFSYAKAGVTKVLCWEINPWSVEGLRKGAEKNKWQIRSIRDGEDHDTVVKGDERLLVFQESNEHAAARIKRCRSRVPLIKHVNCGLLPSSKDSWETAVQVLDPSGGWIHAHENIAKKAIKSRVDEIVETFRDLVDQYHPGVSGQKSTIECGHVEQVKNYAPGIMHCVLDIAVTVEAIS